LETYQARRRGRDAGEERKPKRSEGCWSGGRREGDEARERGKRCEQRREVDKGCVVVWVDGRQIQNSKERKLRSGAPRCGVLLLSFPSFEYFFS
jgi:hypothetical protein